MRFRRWTLAAFASAALAAGTAAGDELRMTAPPESTAGQPTRGMSMDRVEAKFGQPDRRIPAVGDPPITRWEYPNFIVYFEHNLVLHSVVKL